MWEQQEVLPLYFKAESTRKEEKKSFSNIEDRLELIT